MHKSIFIYFPFYIIWIFIEIFFSFYIYINIINQLEKEEILERKGNDIKTEDEKEKIEEKQVSEEGQDKKAVKPIIKKRII